VIGSKVADRWQRFFFRPVPAYPLGLFRIAFGGVCVMYFALLAPDVLTWFGQDGVLPMEDALRFTYGPRLNVLALLPQTDFAIEAFLAFSLLVAVLVLVGFQTRVATVLLWVCLTSFHQRNFYILHAGDTMTRNIAFLLMFTPSDRAFSLDRWLRLRRGVEPPGVPLVAPWSLRLIQFQLCAMYIATVAWKLMGTAWREGTAVHYVLQLDEYRHFAVPAFMHTWWFSKFATWGTLGVELAVPLLVWFRRLRYPVLLCGAALHLGLEYALNIPGLQWVVLSTYILFLGSEPADQASLADDRLQQDARPVGLRIT
jgi:hypothetical protein